MMTDGSSMTAMISLCGLCGMGLQATPAARPALFIALEEGDLTRRSTLSARKDIQVRDTICFGTDLLHRIEVLT